MPSAPLTPETMHQAVVFLAAADPDLAPLAAAGGTPPLWARPPGFPTLVHIILEQQVSLASAQAAYQKLCTAAGSLTPTRFLAFSDQELKDIGFSRQKTRYCRALAAAVQNRELILDHLPALEDHAVRKQLMTVKGIGPWTADIYLLMVLLRPDVWPTGDLALAVAIQHVKKLPSRPDAETMAQIAAAWHPWRAVAARILWQAYLAGSFS